jgi:hypothetical protein
VIIVILILPKFLFKNYISDIKNQALIESVYIEEAATKILESIYYETVELTFIKIKERKTVITSTPKFIYGEYEYKVENYSINEQILIKWKISNGDTPFIQSIELITKEGNINLFQDSEWN